MNKLARIFRIIAFAISAFIAACCIATAANEIQHPREVANAMPFLGALFFGVQAALTLFPIRRVHQSRAMTNILLFVTGLPCVVIISLQLCGLVKGIVMDTNPNVGWYVNDILSNPTADKIVFVLLVIFSQILFPFVFAVFPTWLFFERMRYRRMDADGQTTPKET